MAVETPSRSQWPGKAAVATLNPSRSNASSSAASTGAAAETGGVLDDILAKIIAAPTTEATAAAILAKIIAAPATEAKQDLILTALAGLQTALNTANGHLATIATNTTPP